MPTHNSPNLGNSFATTKNIIACYPEANTQLINPPDMQHFLLLCQWRRHKPVPLLPSLDQTFEFWFKKDSLWQSEDLGMLLTRIVEEPGFFMDLLLSNTPS